MPSDLPILPTGPPAPAPKTTAEKYGGLYYLGVVGLIVVVGLVAWFGIGVWSLRAVWWNVYVLHDQDRSVAERVDAAYQLARNPDVTQRQYWDIALRTELPPLARYLMAESLTSEAVVNDPRGYALAVARSPGWPDWLRLLVARPMAYAADDGVPLPPETLLELVRETDDPFLRLWTAYTILVMGDRAGGAEALARNALMEAASTHGPTGELARSLLDAREQSEPRRAASLDRVTRWLRANDPDAASLWAGWTIQDGHLVRGPVEASTTVPRTSTTPVE